MEDISPDFTFRARVNADTPPLSGPTFSAKQGVTRTEPTRKHWKNRKLLALPGGANAAQPAAPAADEAR